MRDAQQLSTRLVLALEDADAPSDLVSDAQRIDSELDRALANDVFDT